MELMLSRPYPEIVFRGGSQSQNMYYIVIFMNLGFLYLVINKTGEISVVRGVHTTWTSPPQIRLWLLCFEEDYCVGELVGGGWIDSK